MDEWECFSVRREERSYREGSIISSSILVTRHSRDFKVSLMSWAYGAEIVWNGRGEESNAGQDLVCHKKNFMLYLKALVLKNVSQGTDDQSRINGLFGYKEVRRSDCRVPVMIALSKAVAMAIRKEELEIRDILLAESVRISNWLDFGQGER